MQGDAGERRLAAPDIDHCIVCLDAQGPLTSEHIFPEAAGGRLKAPILCKGCNDKLGHCVDAAYLSQKPVELARNAYDLKGKKGGIPQPFSSIYTVEQDGRSLRVRMTGDFTPQVLTESPRVWAVGDEGIGFDVNIGGQDKDKIPAIVRKSLTRFFKTEEGRQLGWNQARQEAAIKNAILQAQKAPIQSAQLQEPIHGQWALDLRAFFAEYVKVIYEICCLAFGKPFLYCCEAKRMRAFLWARCHGQYPDWGLAAARQSLRVGLNVPPQLRGILDAATNGRRGTHHLAIVTQSGVVCSMLGMSAVFSFTESCQMPPLEDGGHVYICDVTKQTAGVYSLAGLLHERSDVN